MQAVPALQKLPDDQQHFYRLIREAAATERAEMVNLTYLGGKTWTVRFSNGAAYRLKVVDGSLVCNRVKKGL